jgi:hypothetical protein
MEKVISGNPERCSSVSAKVPNFDSTIRYRNFCFVAYEGEENIGKMRVTIEIQGAQDTITPIGDIAQCSREFHEVRGCSRPKARN